jgi:hypothetical protein
VEEALRGIQKGKEELQVTDSLKHISILAARPQLTSPSVLVAAVEALVDVATKAGHKEAEYYRKSLQACRRFEESADIFGLCQKLFGSADDKTISSAVAEWSKAKKYANVFAPFGGLQGLQGEASVGQQGWGQPAYPPGGPSWGFGGGAPRAPSFVGRARARYGGNRGGFQRPGVCHFCKQQGHFIARCPNMPVNDRKGS